MMFLRPKNYFPYCCQSEHPYIANIQDVAKNIPYGFLAVFPQQLTVFK